MLNISPVSDVYLCMHDGHWQTGMGLDQITLDMLGRANRAMLRQESTTLLLTGKNKVGAASALCLPTRINNPKLVISNTEPVPLPPCLCQ
jgi:hypothetical protein